MKGFSIIVCCYNSEYVLPETLKSIARLKLPAGSNAELVLIDNACTDRTVSVATEVWKQSGMPFRIVVEKEERAGLSFARKKGMSLAGYDYLLFCDDDNRLNTDYLIYADMILSAAPQIGALGGLGKLDTEQIPSFWPAGFNIFGMGAQAKQNGPADHLHGAGIVIRKSIFDILNRAGFSFILSDRRGKQLSSGGDYELCYAIRLAGFEVWYDDRLKFDHFIPRVRMTWKYCKRFIEESAPALDVLDVYKYVILHPAIKKNGLLRLYALRVEALLFHVKEWLTSFRLSRKYANNEPLHFLERFHQKYHWERLKSICAFTFEYRTVYKKIQFLKEQIEAVVYDWSAKGREIERKIGYGDVL